MEKRPDHLDPPDAAPPDASTAVHPTMPPIRWDYETPRPPPAPPPQQAEAPATPPDRPRRTRWGPLITAAAGGALLALGCVALLLGVAWLLGAPSPAP